MPLTHLLRLCCSQCLLIFLLCDVVAVWVFSASVRRSHLSQLRLRCFMCATKCGRCSLKCWQAGQRYGMVASSNGCQSGGPLTYFKNSNLSSIEKSRWGMSTMTEFCGEAGLQVSRHVAGRHMAYYRSQ